MFKVKHFIVFVIFSASLLGQTEPKFVFESSVKYTQSDIDSLILNPDRLEHLSDLLMVLKTDQNLYGMSAYYRYKSSEHFRNAQYDSTIIYADWAYQDYLQSKIQREIDERMLMSSFINKAAALKAKKDFTNSILNYQKANELAKVHKYKWKAFILTGIADSHIALGEDSTALKYYKESTLDSNYMSIPRSAITVHTRIGSIYQTFRQYDKSLNHYQLALSKSHNSNFKSNISALLGNIGSVYQDLNRIDSTLFYYKKAIQFQESNNELGYDNQDNYHKVRVSFIDLHEGKPASAIDSLHSVIYSVNSSTTLGKNEQNLMSMALTTLSMAYEQTNNPKGYQTILKASEKFYSGLLKSQIENDIAKIELKYQAKSKDQRIEQLVENELQQKVILKQKNLISYGSLGGLISFVFFAMYYIKQRNLSIQYEKENLKQRLLRSQMSPHFIFNSLHSISMLIEKKSEGTISYIKNISNLVRLILKNSREEFVSINDEIDALDYYLKLRNFNLEDFEYTLDLDDISAQERMIIPPMLIQPFVENALVHGFKTKKEGYHLSLKFDEIKNEKLVRCTIVDNGIGFDAKQTKIDSEGAHLSVSTSIIKERLQLFKKKFKVNARLLIEERTSGGTIVQLYLPYFIE